MMRAALSRASLWPAGAAGGRAANVLSAIKACAELGVDDASLIEPADLLEGKGTIRHNAQRTALSAQGRRGVGV